MYRPLIVFVSAFVAAAAVLTSGPTFSAPKEPGDDKAPRQRATAPTPKPQPKPIERPRQATSCAQYGAGFMRMPGSDSCVRIGGGVEMGVGAVP